MSTSLETTVVDYVIGFSVPLVAALVGWGIHALLLHFHIAGTINLPCLTPNAVTALAQAAETAANSAIAASAPKSVTVSQV